MLIFELFQYACAANAYSAPNRSRGTPSDSMCQQPGNVYLFSHPLPGSNTTSVTANHNVFALLPPSALPNHCINRISHHLHHHAFMPSPTDGRRPTSNHLLPP
ncbi:hypothetical protein SprV_0100256700 [Sparganum proliferum]